MLRWVTGASVLVSLVSAVSLAVIYLIFQTAFSVVLPVGLLRGII